MNVKTIFTMVLLNVLTEGNPNNPINLKFEIEPKSKKADNNGKIVKNVKLTSYYTPKIIAFREPNGKYKHRINVYKKGKTFPIYISSSKGLYVEGYVRVSLPDETFYLSHDWCYSNKPLNSKGRPLRKGQAASRFFKKGTKFVYKGDTIIITDTGSGLSKNKPHIDLYLGEGNEVYKKQTEFSEIRLLDNN